MYQLNNFQMMVLRSSTIVFYFHSFMICITTRFRTLLTMFPEIQADREIACIDPEQSPV